MTELPTLQIRNKVLRSELVRWRGMEFIQKSSFKKLSEQSTERLRNSIIINGFIKSFNVWQSPEGKIICLDGYHRCRMLRQLAKEGYEIPELLTANFLDCASREEAAKLVLVYSSPYARIESDGFEEFLALNNLELGDVISEITAPE